MNTHVGTGAQELDNSTLAFFWSMCVTAHMRARKRHIQTGLEIQEVEGICPVCEQNNQNSVMVTLQDGTSMQTSPAVYLTCQEPHNAVSAARLPGRYCADHARERQKK